MTIKPLRIGAAILIAILLKQDEGMTNEAWMLISIFLMSITTLGTPIRQSVAVMLTILAALGVNQLLQHLMPPAISFIIFNVILLSSSFIYLINGWRRSLCLYLNVVFIFILIIAYFMAPVITTSLMHQIMAVGIGTLLTIGIVHLFFTRQLSRHYASALAPPLNALTHYAATMSAVFLGDQAAIATLPAARVAVENHWNDQFGAYPSWAYEPGFNPGLSPGFRYFLIHLERLVESFLALDYFLQQFASMENAGVDADFWRLLATAMQKNQQLLTLLAIYFQENRYEAITTDFTQDIATIESRLKAWLPAQVELMDLAFESQLLIEYVRHIKEIRSALLQLVMSLPAAKVTPPAASQAGVAQ